MLTRSVLCVGGLWVRWYFFNVHSPYVKTAADISGRSTHFIIESAQNLAATVQWRQQLLAQPATDVFRRGSQAELLYRHHF